MWSRSPPVKMPPSSLHGLYGDCALVALGLRIADVAYTAVNEVSVFSANSSSTVGLALFFHLNNQVVFRAHSPAAMWRERASTSS